MGKSQKNGKCNVITRQLYVNNLAKVIIQLNQVNPVGFEPKSRGHEANSIPLFTSQVTS